LEGLQIKMKLENFNLLGKEAAANELFKCCGCTNWLNKLIEFFPFSSIEDLKIHSDKIWFTCTEEDWKEAFSHHPKIGQKELENKFNATRDWASNEQSGVKNSPVEIISELASQNELYEKTFGFIFIVCATGKSAEEMLKILRDRLNNDPAKELHMAANEQNKITHLRMDKLLS
jgi:2-oxo-4-hydroxy-4-carboxy-5-ureidoimidazoline decarboxylase